MGTNALEFPPPMAQKKPVRRVPGRAIFRSYRVDHSFHHICPGYPTGVLNQGIKCCRKSLHVLQLHLRLMRPERVPSSQGRVPRNSTKRASPQAPQVRPAAPLKGSDVHSRASDQHRTPAVGTQHTLFCAPGMLSAHYSDPPLGPPRTGFLEAPSTSKNTFASLRARVAKA